MAAYGALVSLSHILHQILNPPPLNKIVIDRQQIEFLQGKVNFLIDFLETYSSRRNQEIADLEPQIVRAAYAAEDIIKSNVVEQILTNGKDQISSTLSQGVQTVLGDFISIEEELMKIKDKGELLKIKDSKADLYSQKVNDDDLQPKNPTRARHPTSEKMTMVGFEEHITQIMDALTIGEPTRQVIPILGMGGIGKTTLASAIYDHPSVVEYFEVRAWVTISQEYIVEDLLLCLLSGITKEGSKEIGEKLYKELYGRRYLIVMDDMWDIEVWDKVKRFLPVNDNGSRILVTTRLSNLAHDLESCISHTVGLLDEDNSWNLLRQKVFGKEDCPGKLEEIGKSIAKRCGGLPLAIVVIGGLLAKSEMTKEHWEFIEGDVTSSINYGNEEHFMEILLLSYTYLPIYLKPCFLYLTVFSEDAQIPRSDLVRLWVSEGLIKLTQAKCLEEIADDYFEDLISRNLLLISEWGHSGTVSHCKVHDLLRDLCISKAEKENFLYIIKPDNSVLSPNIKTAKRLVISSPNQQQEGYISSPHHTVIDALHSARFTRSWTSIGNVMYSWQESSILRGFRLLRVAHVQGERECSYHEMLRCLINLRYICLPTEIWQMPKMSRYWNLQTLQITSKLYLPTEIWQMPQIRHIESSEGFFLPYPCDQPTEIWQMPQIGHLGSSEGFFLPYPCDQNVIVLENLQTLEVVEDFTFTEEVAERIPNLKKLKIRYHKESPAASRKYCLKNLVRFKKLESLGLHGDKKLWSDISLPDSLKELHLRGCFIPWEDMSIFGKLANLEVLKLMDHATSGKEWNPVEGEFRRLKYLMICYSKLAIWGVESCHFPSLESLSLMYLFLKEIPMSLAEIITLQVIRIYPDVDSLRRSAKAVSDEREVLGYEPCKFSGIDKQDEWQSIHGVDSRSFLMWPGKVVDGS